VTDNIEPKITVFFGSQFAVRIRMKVLCTEHKDMCTGKKENVILEEGMITERGLICPTCYAPVRFVAG